MRTLRQVWQEIKDVVHKDLAYPEQRIKELYEELHTLIINHLEPHDSAQVNTGVSEQPVEVSAPRTTKVSKRADAPTDDGLLS